MSFIEWYVCYPVDTNKIILPQLKCFKTIPTAIHEKHKDSKLIPVCRFQPKFMKEFMLKYKYYGDTKASIETDLKTYHNKY